MAKKEKKDRMILFLIIFGAVAYFMFSGNVPGLQPVVGDEDVGMVLEIRQGGEIQAVVDGSDYGPGAQGRFGISITNNKDIPIFDVGPSVTHAPASSQYSHDDSAGTNTPFVSAELNFAPISSLGSLETSPIQYTDWFDLEYYADNNEGNTEFYAYLIHTFRDAEGNYQYDQALTGAATVEICPSNCGDSTYLNNCNGDGLKCVYNPGSCLSLVNDQTCCGSAGGVWTGSACTFTCAASGLGLGECYQSDPNPGTAIRATYCDPSSALMIESCGTPCNNGGNAHCWDIYGATEQSCSAQTCTFIDYGSQGVTVNVQEG